MSEVKYTLETCPANCASADFPAVNFSDCTDAFVSEESEITDIWISPEDDANAGQPKYKPTDWLSKAAWDTATSQSGAGLKRLTVIGDKPLPETASRTVSKGRIVLGESTHTVNFDIDDVTPENYALMRRAQCSGRWVMWYATKRFIYGGAKGFSANVANAGEVLQRGDNYTVLSFIMNWKSPQSPPRAANPYYV